VIENWLEQVRPLRVLVVGDAIIDEYCYVKPLGKSPKENIIATEFQEREIFHGGVWAAAAHVEGFCNIVNVARGELITTKRRFVEKAYMRKIFEVHEVAHSLTRAWRLNYEDYDLVIVTDFGHGFITAEMIENMTAKAKYLAVNTQTNSANFGFNMISRYPRADLVVLDELEARLAAHDRDSTIEHVIKKLGFQRVIVTLGYNGAVGFEDGAFYRDRAAQSSVVDTMGAGDAFFCVCAPFACMGVKMPELLRIGNAAGAAKVQIVGHRQPITPEALKSLFA